MGRLNNEFYRILKEGYNAKRNRTRKQKLYASSPVR